MHPIGLCCRFRTYRFQRILTIMKYILHYITSVLILLVLMSACTPADPTYPNASLLLSTDDFEAQKSLPNTIVIDTRMSFEEFKEAHIPGAIYFHSRRDMEDKENPVRYFMIQADEFESKMQALGINSDSNVLIYDEGDGLGAARLFYGLEYYGFEGRIALLNGGFAGWNASEKPTTVLDEEPISFEVTAGNFTARVQEDRQCDIAYVRGVEPGSSRIIFDVRSADEYNGIDVRAAEGGHIEGAVNLEWSSVLVDGDVPYYRSFEEITEMYAALGVTPDKEVIPHCHTNVRGSHAYFSLRLMGYDSVRPYEGSWEEFGNAGE